ncbi:NPCBM/NEW2 domain-containing protein [Sorangium sp. So ce1078]|uniref:NPCBM/NEW2 domain-containing protein n=1 Tax=Sorangium sp. So ce1078 TaxID=3133329 RepID=UPI003F630A09
MICRSLYASLAHSKIMIAVRECLLGGFAIAVVAVAAPASIATASCPKYLGSDIAVQSVSVGSGNFSVDRNWYGPGFHIGGVYYSKGFYVHAPSVASFPLNGAFSQFTGCVGQDDGDGDCGNGSRIRVYGDGRLLWERDIGNGPAVCPPHLNIAGVQTLVFEADPKGDKTCDEVEWVNALVF